MTDSNQGTSPNRERKKAIAVAIIGFLGFSGLIGYLGFKNIQNRSFHTLLFFPSARGITRGMPVTYWGVKIGEVMGFNPEPKGVAIEVEIWPAERQIPRDSFFKVARVEGEMTIDIQPRNPLPPNALKMKPRSSNCDPKIILCNNKRISSIGRLSLRNLVYSLNSIQDINSGVQSVETNVGAVTSDVHQMKTTVQELGQLGQEARGLLNSDKLDKTLTKLDTTLTSLQRAADQISLTAQSAGRLSNQASGFVENARQARTLDRLNSTLVSVGGVADEVQLFLRANRNNLGTTLSSIEQLSKQVTLTVRKLDPLAEQIQSKALLENLETISKNAAQLTANLSEISSQFNDAQSHTQLQHILDAARSLLDNLNKITSDIDELTGNPRLRGDILRLIQGLSHLLSSTQLLQQQVAYGKVLTQVATESDRPKALQP
jgi:phospholipid/cholesterol/gamma-HCH transport system substrate-binding protein